MKFFKWKFWLLTSILCLAPIALGLAMWDSLPETMAIHFDINNQPDGFASKGFTVFGLPVLMVVLQTVCCLINDINAARYGIRKKLEAATKWLIPVMSFALYTVTLAYNSGQALDIRRIVCVIVGCVFLTVGNYMPKLDCIKDCSSDTHKARKINRFIGFATIIMGLLMLISIFLPPIASVAVIILLIPYAIVCLMYGIIVGKR